ncbi:protein DEPP1 [Microcaecilia unicolor]|uniref:Protein DEPP1 n=1 Tax=Microcaecilia unicolor TaxID=1415580 RepID=A0A6P7Y7E6_9AMPH|nr:protein DEPP1 [Microcaecilia unicolor]
MRSKLLTSVSALPTICEYVEEATEDGTKEKQEERSSQTHSPQALDEYVKSIQQLAQPTSLSDDALRVHYSVQNRLHRRSKHNHVPSIKNQNKMVPSSHGTVLQDFNIQLPQPPSEMAFVNSNDPLNLLYGQDEKSVNKENSPLTRMTAHFHYAQSMTAICHPVSVLQPQKQTETGKKCLRWGIRCSETKACKGAVQKPDHSTEVPGNRRSSQRLHKTYIYSSNSRGRLSRSQNQHLPVIYEL